MTKQLAEKARTLSIEDRAEREKQNKFMQVAFIFAERLRKEGFIVNLDDKENDRVIMVVWWK